MLKIIIALYLLAGVNCAWMSYKLNYQDSRAQFKKSNFRFGGDSLFVLIAVISGAVYTVLFPLFLPRDIWAHGKK